MSEEKSPEETTEEWPPKQKAKSDALDLDQEALSQLEELTDSAQENPPLKELLRSTDSPTRFMTLLSFVFGFLAVLCMGLLITLYVRMHHGHKVVAPPPKAAFEKVLIQNLGDFNLVIKASPTLAEDRTLTVEVNAECSNLDTYDLIKANLEEVRDVVAPLLLETTAEDWGNAEAKTLLRRKIADNINSLNFPGKVLQVDFSFQLVEKER